MGDLSVPNRKLSFLLVTLDFVFVGGGFVLLPWWSLFTFVMIGPASHCPDKRERQKV
jgi:hypothetical protein